MTGSRLLHYEIHDLLGSGGSGAVYRATDTRLDRPVALKFFHEGSHDSSHAIKRLRTEAKAAARLDHPNIGSVYAIEYVPDGRLFISMAYYPGETVAALLEREGSLPLGKALAITIQVLRGLERAHDTGVVHRDIKPANVMLLPDGLVKILDFGLATAGDLLQAGSGPGWGGTVEYMSPQQVRGEKVDHRADIWAAGALLYRMIRGVSPFFDAESQFATIYNIASRTPARLTESDPSLPPMLDVVIERALSKSLERRYSDAASFVQDLEGLSLRPGSLPVPTEAPGAARRVVGGTNLPARLPLLLGRGNELRLIDLYLGEDESRAVTLLGPGGIGKTTLALHAARRQELEHRFPHGVYFVALDSVPKPESIGATIARAVDHRLDSGGSADAQLIKFLGNKHLLLVLDGVEHLVAGLGFVRTLLDSCPNVKLLLTSRERTNLPDEWLVSLPGLPLPPVEVTDPRLAAGFDSVALFCKHAKRAAGEFELDVENLGGVVAICRLVQGHPLAIELAAGWARHLSPARIAVEIEEGFGFLSSRASGASARHLSIRAVFEHSWGLLDEAEQDALMRVSVFRGTFTDAAAESVTETPLWLLADLVDKSLLQVSDDERFEQHPLWRQYSEEKLMADGDAQGEVLSRHAEYYLAALLEHGTRLRHGEHGPDATRIEDELENVRLAWHTMVQLRDAQAISRAAEPLRTFFDLKSRAAEGAGLLNEALEALDSKEPEQSLAHANVSAQLAWLMLPSGNVEGAEKYALQALPTLKEHGDARGLYWAVNALGASAAHRGAFDRAKEQFERCHRLAGTLGDSALLAASLDNLAGVEQALGDVDRARLLYESALSIAREDRNLGQTIATLNNLGALLLTVKLPVEAKPLLMEGFTLARQAGAQRYLPFCIANLGEVNYLLGEHAEAAKAYQDGIESARAGGNVWLECALTADLARVAAVLNDYGQTRDLLLRSLELAENIDDVPLILHAASCYVEAMKGSARAEALELARLVLEHPRAHIDDKSSCAAILGIDTVGTPVGVTPDLWRETVRGAIGRIRG
jgi:predicted ATPase